MKNNKKGFTLIELLAVIVVLAIIMVIATTQVTRAMKTAAVDSFVTSYRTIVKEVKNKMTLNDLALEDTTFVCTTDCATLYDLSAEDYSMTLEEALVDESTASGIVTKKYYNLTLTGNGKFKNIDLTSDNKCPLSGACTAKEIKVNFDSNGKVTAGHKS